MLNRTLFGGFLAILLCTGVRAQEEATDTLSIEDMMAAYQAYADSVEATLTYHADTTVGLGDGLALLNVPEGYRYLDADDAFTVLVDIWGNPPGGSMDSYGMLFPDSLGPFDDGSYGIDIFYTEDGYVSDDDAADMDYDELLEEMRADTEAANPERVEQGYEPMHLLGWAAPPRYDAANKRLHWAKKLQFEEQEDPTLNYNVLFLGRRGYLTMNVIGNMDALPEVDAALPGILSSVDYAEGHRYADFDPDVDEVAAYGLAALVAGKVLTKTGLLAGVGIFLAKAWKLVLIGFVAAGAGIKKMLGK